MAVLAPQIPSIVDVYPRDHTIPSKLESFSPFNCSDDSLSIDDLICALQTCRKKRSSRQAKHLHACLCEIGRDSHAVLESHLVPMLIDCGCVRDAQNVFNKASKQSEHSWTSLIQGLVESDERQCTFDLYGQMHNAFIQPSHFTYVALLKGCCRWRYVDKTMEIHTMIVIEGCESNPFVGSTLVDTYATCGLIHEAQVVFKSLPASVVSITALLSGYTENGYGEEALDHLEQMQLEGGLHLDSVLLNCGLKACSITRALQQGQILHADLIMKGYDRELLLANMLINMYATCGSLVEAQYVHNNLHARDVITWTTLLAGIVENGFEREGFDCLETMELEGVFLDEAALICGIKLCGSIKALTKGQELHMKFTKQGDGRDPYAGSAIVDMYVKCGSIVEAQATIDKLFVKDVASWNALMGGCADLGSYEQALGCLIRMQQEGVPPNHITFTCGMKCCGAIGSKVSAHGIHIEILKRGFEDDPFVTCTILDVYIKCKLFTEAQEVFDRLLVKDEITWNALVRGYSEYGSAEDVLHCLEQMLLATLTPNLFTYICCFKVCSDLGSLSKGQKVHIEVVKKGLDVDTMIGNSIVDMYMKCGVYMEGLEVFNKLQERDVVSWTALILGCTEHGSALGNFQEMQLEGVSPDVVLWNAVILSCAKQEDYETAFKLYAQMLEQGSPPNSVIWGSVLQACGDAAALEMGRRFHIQSREASGTVLGTVLVDMYSKCGRIKDAHQEFDAMLLKDMVSWDALVKGYARLVEVDAAFDILQNVTAQRLMPNESILLSFLTACSHAGFVLRGQIFFETLINVFDVSPTFAHYNVMIDLLGRAGLVDEAWATLQLVPSLITGDPVLWGTALGACKGWDGLEFAELSLDLLSMLDDAHPGTLVLMSNIYAENNTGSGIGYMWLGQDLTKAKA